MNRENIKQGKNRGNISNKKRATRKELRLIPLSEEIKKELMEPESGSSEERSGSASGSEAVPLECIIDLIRTEVRKYISELKLSETFVRKAELSSLCDYLIMKSKSPLDERFNENEEKENEEDEATEDTADDMERREREALNELENAFLAEQDFDDSSRSGLGEKEITNSSSHENGSDINGRRGKSALERNQNCDSNFKSSVHIMFTMTNKFNDSENSSGKESDRCERPSYQNTALRNLDSRLSVLEMKVSSLDRLLKKIRVLSEKDEKGPNEDIKTRQKEEPTGRNSLNIRIQNCLNNEIGAIEAEVQKTLFETDFLPGIFSDEIKMNHYDELYYEWRQYRMNMLRYKKSQRSVYLNQRPRIQQFVKPPCPQNIYTSSRTKIRRRPGFIITPSRTKYKPVDVCA